MSLRPVAAVHRRAGQRRRGWIRSGPQVQAQRYRRHVHLVLRRPQYSPRFPHLSPHEQYALPCSHAPVRRWAPQNGEAHRCGSWRMLKRTGKQKLILMPVSPSQPGLRPPRPRPGGSHGIFRRRPTPKHPQELGVPPHSMFSVGVS